MRGWGGLYRATHKVGWPVAPPRFLPQPPPSPPPLLVGRGPLPPRGGGAQGAWSDESRVWPSGPRPLLLPPAKGVLCKSTDVLVPPAVSFSSWVVWRFLASTVPPFVVLFLRPVFTAVLIALCAAATDNPFPIFTLAIVSIIVSTSPSIPSLLPTPLCLFVTSVRLRPAPNG